MADLLHDVRVSVRSFCRRPGLLVVILGTLGLGVGAATTVYSVVHGRSVDMTQFLAQSVADRRFVASVVTAFALLSLLLTIVGVYGTLAYAVSQRRRELGVRLAMGATGSAVLRAVLFRSTRTVAVGVALGLGASLVATRFLRSQLFGVTSTDPLTVGLAVGLVLAAAMAASFVPARRAGRVDPMVSLRME